MTNRINKFQFSVLCCWLVSLLSLGASTTAGQGTQTTPLDLARILVRELQPENTSYQHKQGFVKWKGENGATAYESRTDCSGFLNALLERAYGLTRDDFEKWLGKRRPLAVEYYEAIRQQNNFRQIKAVREVRPGDVIAIRYPPGTNENTGHIMLIADVPKRRKASEPLVENLDQWEVSVIDSSESGHGRTDTRRKSDGTFGDGVGQGILRLYTNASGDIIGYSWSTFAKSDYYDQSTRQMLIGRPGPLGKSN